VKIALQASPWSRADLFKEAGFDVVEGLVKTEDELIDLLKDADGETVLKLNESSVLIWELCNGELTVGEMVQLLADSYPEAAEEMRKDVFRALDELNEEAVIQIES